MFQRMSKHRCRALNDSDSENKQSTGAYLSATVACSSSITNRNLAIIDLNPEIIIGRTIISSSDCTVESEDNFDLNYFTR